MNDRAEVAPLLAHDRWAASLPAHAEKPPSMRVFGLVMIIGFGFLGGLAVWSGRAADSEWRLAVGWTLMTLGVIIFLWSLASPRTLPPIYHLWMRFGQAIGHVVSTVLLSVLYFVVFVIVGRLMRWFGTDPLDRRIERQGAGSYWRRHSPPSKPGDYAHMS